MRSAADVAAIVRPNLELGRALLLNDQTLFCHNLSRRSQGV